MKTTLYTSELQKKLSFINHAVTSKGQLPILLNILLEVKNGKVELSSTDLEIGLKTSLKAKIEEEGATTVPARTFTELISSLTHEETTLSLEDSLLTVSTPNTRSVFQTIPAHEFPKLFEEKGEPLVTLSTKHLRDDFVSVIFAASGDTTRPALSGVLVKSDAGEKQGLLLVATDGYRLSLKNGSTVTSPTEEVKLIVPARVLRELMTLKDESDEIKVHIAPGQNQILFEQNETIVVGRLIEATFPTYEKIIPTDVNSSTTFDREELLKAVKICSIFARDAANIIKFTLKKDSIVVSSQTPSVGENTVSVEAKLTGEENEIAFNAKYLLDVLSNLEANTLSFEMTGPLNPGVFRIAGDTSYLHLIMPIRVQG